MILSLKGIEKLIDDLLEISKTSDKTNALKLLDIVEFLMDTLDYESTTLNNNESIEIYKTTLIKMSKE